MKIAILKETQADESRVAVTPEIVKKYLSLWGENGVEIVIETGAGLRASFDDKDYEAAGGTIVKTANAALKNADIVLKVQRPNGEELAHFNDGAKLIGILSPFDDPDFLTQYAKGKVDSFAMDFMPRITRAQSMDVLSSQSNLAGYKAVIDATAHYGSAMPMMMTAAGTIAPAKVFVMGAGVAGLQAIATARRLGAVVTATDVRFAAKEQVESLGAGFVTVDEEAMKEAETSGGYAKEMSDDFKQRQAEFVAEHLKKQDIVITTALIPGRPAPNLIDDKMLDGMKAGSIVVDLAVERGGNVSASKPGKVVKRKGVSILGYANVAGRLATDASSLYARNLYNFIAAFYDKESGHINFDPADEIITGVALTRDGEIVHTDFAQQSEAEISSPSSTPTKSDTGDVKTDEEDQA